MEPLNEYALTNLNVPYLARVTKMTTKLEEFKNEAKLVVVLYQIKDGPPELNELLVSDFWNSSEDELSEEEEDEPTPQIEVEVVDKEEHGENQQKDEKKDLHPKVL